MRLRNKHEEDQHGEDHEEDKKTRASKDHDKHQRKTMKEWS
jgi:hypothetical protein